MKLIVDIGNSYIKATILKENNIYDKFTFGVNRVANFFKLIEEKNIKTIFISSVGNTFNFENKLSDIKIIYFNDNLKIPIDIQYKEIEKLGKDRISALVGANKLYPNKNLLVIDIGTCITLDVLSKKGVFLGGRISPGIKLRYKSLSTAKSLPYLKFKYQKNLYGNDTESSIHTGIQRSIISEINDFRTELLKQLNNISVIVTGGDVFFLHKELKNTIFVEENLVPIGMNEIMIYNEI